MVGNGYEEGAWRKETKVYSWCPHCPLDCSLGMSVVGSEEEVGRSLLAPSTVVVLRLVSKMNGETAARWKTPSTRTQTLWISDAL